MEILKKDSQTFKALEIATFFIIVTFLFFFVISIINGIQFFESEVYQNAIAGLRVK